MPRPMTTAFKHTAFALVALVGFTAVAQAQASPPPAYSARAVHRLPDGTETLSTVIAELKSTST